MRRISWHSSGGIRGRPGLDLMRQNSRQPARCQRISVSGRTTTKASRQSKSRKATPATPASRRQRAAALRHAPDTAQVASGERGSPLRRFALVRTTTQRGRPGRQVSEGRFEPTRSRHDHATARRTFRNGVSSSRIQYLRSTIDTDRVQTCKMVVDDRVRQRDQ